MQQCFTAHFVAGFIKKINLVFFALGVAFVLGTVGGMKASQITAGFSSSMFVTLVGVTFMFGMASQNWTLELFSKKVVALAGKHTVLIPILMFVLSAFISAIPPAALRFRSWPHSSRNINDDVRNVLSV